MQLPRVTRLVVGIAGERMYLRRAVHHEGEVLDMLVQRRCDTRAALRLMHKLLKKQGFVPKLLVTDTLRSYASAFRRLRLTCPHEQGSGETIGPKIHISLCGYESARCSASNRLNLPSASSACMPRSITPSTFNAISSRDQRCEPFEPRRRANGGMEWPLCDRAILLLASPIAIS
jgi:transposase-like protein